MAHQVSKKLQSSVSPETQAHNTGQFVAFRLSKLEDSTTFPSNTRRGYLTAKRSLDLLLSTTVILLCAPLLALIALAIRLTSPGPVLFRQMRVGEGGRVFMMYKFRSMYADADHTLHQLAYTRFLQGQGGNGKVGKDTLHVLAQSSGEQTAKQVPEIVAPREWALLGWLRNLLRLEDPRITPVGALLRATSIDELPQFFNVLRGEMTLVGPRPPIPYEVRLYQPRHCQRLLVRPGLTGFWQIYGRNRVPFEKMVEMDLEYIRQRNFWLDLELIARTPIAMLQAHGAR
jgi:lipopolysaccharide/colanic/teichoic acid biosynthesis glycosyltransferase